ncbi:MULTISPECIES: hypothetical protein [Bacteroides]|jgi:predicted DNA-binding protein|uniref:Antitoxin n=1 Tax=Siphoviridae sp. ctyjS2 TaxID=2827284 RepID=A0A8S5R4F3_9CAUD|nr:hypothetical protein [Bacteroides sp. KFT8]DAE26010.1 MAG TPA: antitoxin [Siphoviridae sp. ctyjS2]
MEYKKRLSVRLDERTAMLLAELSEITKTSSSVIIRSIMQRGINELIDESGNWKIQNEKTEKGKS